MEVHKDISAIHAHSGTEWSWLTD